MRNSHQGMSVNYNNEVTQAIDCQLVFAPQYGIMGTPPKFDPPPQTRGKRRNNRFLRQDKSAKVLVRSQRTKDLKMCINILEAELTLIDSGKLPMTKKVRDQMETRLQLMRAEKARRDLRDLADGKITPTGFFSVGVRLARAA